MNKIAADRFSSPAVFLYDTATLYYQFMKDKLASCENLSVEIWKILAPKISAISKFGKLYSLRLYETPRNYVEYFGE